jgi:D-tyrosyl-tRNA(Tyr) deacylase
MRAIVQRVSEAQVDVDGRTVASIGRGVVALLGIAEEDAEEEADWLAAKVADLRIFEDSAGKMNLSLHEIAGEALVVPNFTVYADCRKGRRPSFTRAAAPERACALFERFSDGLQARQVRTARGIFGAHMRVGLVNDGPVTLLVESPPRADGPA